MSEPLIDMLKRHEGYKRFPYEDSVYKKLTVGYGTNLDDRGISKDEAEFMLLNDIERITNELRSRISYWHKLSVTRRDVLVNMAYNLGLRGLFTFKKMFVALEMNDYDKTGDEIMNSKAAMQTGRRYLELAELMRGGC